MNPFSSDYKPVLTITAKERAYAKTAKMTAARNQEKLDRNGPTTHPDAEQRRKDKAKNDRLKLAQI